MGEGQENVPGGDGQGAGGVEDKSKNQNVSYESHQRLLDQKKAKDKELADAQAKLKAFEDEKSAKEKTDLEAKGELKKLLDLEKAEKDKKEAELSTLKAKLATGSKIGAVLEKLSGEVDRKYFDKIDVSKVKIDPETGEPDEASVKEAAKHFEVNFPEVIKKPSKGGLPNDAARGGGAKLTYDAWSKLSPKEQREKLGDVDLDS